MISHAGAHAISPAARNLADEQLDAVAESDGIVGCTFGVGHLCPDGNDEDASLSTLLDHVEYFAERMGVEHVGLGSDFDGATVPEDVGDVTGLRDGLEARGFDRSERAAIASGNWRRVLDEWWE